MIRVREYLANKNIDVSNRTIEKFQEYYESLIEWNSRFNLTSITQYDDVIVKHYIDSLSAIDYISNGAKVLDLGAGAGFPSIPIKLVRDDISLVMIDSLNKRVNFLKHIIETLQLSDTIALHSRAEDMAKGHYRQTQDCILVRAVANLSTLLEYSIPMLRVGGKCIAYKSQDYQEELERSKVAQIKLNCKVIRIEEFNLLDTDNKRALIIFEKTAKTNEKYPREKNLPKKNPL